MKGKTHEARKAPHRQATMHIGGAARDGDAAGEDEQGARPVQDGVHEGEEIADVCAAHG